MKEFFVLVLATWRLSSLLADENGPYNVFDKLRRLAGVDFVGTTSTADYADNNVGISENGSGVTGELATGLICKWCNSVWIGIFITVVLWITGNKLASPVLPFALSGGSIVVDRWINVR